MASRMTSGKTIVRDPIHGSIELDPVLVKIIDTPQFQRLRRIKQLGGACFVYPGAVHTRFEHSIGVCHIAGELLKSLGEVRKIDKEDILCVQIAALCHDLGHGPFSHVYDTLLEDYWESTHPDESETPLMKHEYRSAEIVELLLEDLWETDEFKQAGLEKENHLKFIKKLITFDKDLKGNPDLMKKWTEEDMGCNLEKCYLFEIVANGHTGIDVDKMDYFTRDSHGLGLPNRFDWRRFAQVARVVDIPELGYPRLCTRDKEVDNLYELFHTRLVLYRNAYHHKNKCIVERMIRDALKDANDCIKIKGKWCIMECWQDMDAFQLLDDTIVDVILKMDPHQPDDQHDGSEPAESSYITIFKGEKLVQARDKLRRVVDTRKLPKFVGKEPKENVFKSGDKKEEETKAKEKLVREAGAGKEKHLILEVVKFNYGKKDKNPMLEHYFYSKHYPDHPFTLSEEEVSKMLPKAFEEELVFWFYDTHEHEHAKYAEDELAKEACKLLRDHFHTDKLPHALPAHHEQRDATETEDAGMEDTETEDAGLNDTINRQNGAIKRQKEAVQESKDTHQRTKKPRKY